MKIQRVGRSQRSDGYFLSRFKKRVWAAEYADYADRLRPRNTRITQTDSGRGIRGLRRQTPAAEYADYAEKLRDRLDREEGRQAQRSNASLQNFVRLYFPARLAAK